MRHGLLIGEAAKMLGVTPKAIRHYHRIGLLEEPRRSPSGYRLYDARDVLRLYRIRRLQRLGLSLAQVRTVLASPNEGSSLRRALGILRARLAEELASLQARLAQIDRLLATEGPGDLASTDATSPTFELLLEHLGDQLATVDPAVVELDRQLFARLDDLFWADPDYGKRLREILQYVASHPEQYRGLVAVATEIVALAEVPPDSPRIDDVARDLRALLAGSPLLTKMAEGRPSEPGIVAEILGEVVSELAAPSFSPAQRRLFELVAERHHDYPSTFTHPPARR